MISVAAPEHVEGEQIAKIVMDEIGVHVPIKYTGDYKGRKGDVHKYSFDVTKLRMFGWGPQYKAEEAIRKAVQLNR